MNYVPNLSSQDSAEPTPTADALQRPLRSAAALGCVRSQRDYMSPAISRVHGDQRPIGRPTWGNHVIGLCSVGYTVMFTLGILVAPLVREARPPMKLPQVGFLTACRQDDHLRQGASENSGTGCASSAILKDRASSLRCDTPRGASIAFPSWRWGSIRLPVDVLVVGGPQVVRAARDATSTIPIVMARIDDADEVGFVASLARPGSNITGLSFRGRWLKRQVDRAAPRTPVPSLSRVAALWDITSTANQLRTLERAAPALGVHLHVVEVRSPDDFASAFAAAHTAQAEGLVLLGSPLLAHPHG